MISSVEPTPTAALGSTMRTKRLALRPWRPFDQADLSAAVDIYSNDQVLRWLGATPQSGADAATAQDWIDGWAALDDGVRGLWAVVPMGAEGSKQAPPVGTVLLAKLPRSDGLSSDATQIGWHLHPDVWGRGYATEATLAVIDRARAAGLRQVHALVYPENLPSLSVCDRLGMDRLGLTKEWENIEVVDHVLTL